MKFKKIKHSIKKISNDKKLSNIVEDNLIRKVESILRILEKEEIRSEKLKSKLGESKKDIKKYKNELIENQSLNKRLKKEIINLQNEIENLNENLEILNKRHLESVGVSVNLLSSLEYSEFKASFVDIDIKFPTGNKKIIGYCRNIKKFFLHELKCSYIKISYNGVNEYLKILLNIKSKKNYSQLPGYLNDRMNIYCEDLVDVDLPERIIGKIIIGRQPYEDSKKESHYNKKIKNEIFFLKRILENCIKDLQNQELAVKDALTGLYTRKFFEEKLSDEFFSLDYFSKLPDDEKNLLNVIILADAKPRKIIRNKFFIDRKTKDENLFDVLINKLHQKKIISINKGKYLGESSDIYVFESSKVENNLFVAMLDLDHFKDVNDNWGGHSVGDEILKKFSLILKKYIRTTDIPIRFGGEEFVIVFPRATSFVKIRQVLDGIRSECERNLIIEYLDKTRNVTVSIGLTRISKYDKNIVQILNRADAALYKAKRKRNRIVVYEQGPKSYININL